MKTAFFVKLVICILSAAFTFYSSPCLASVFGYVNDLSGNPVKNASVTFVNESDSAIIFGSATDDEGRYYIPVTVFVENSADGNPETFVLNQNYPNPFNPSTTISFHMNESGLINLTIYNVLGQKVRTLINDTFPIGLHRIQWNGSDDRGNSVGAGIYIYQMRSKNKIESKKMLLMDGGNIRNSSGAFSYNIPETSKKTPAESSSGTYRVNITGDGVEPYEQTGIQLVNDEQYDFVVSKYHTMLFAVQGDYFGIWNGIGYSQLFIKGVNLGISVPGTHPGQLAATREQYMGWLERIGEIGINSIRLYTLHFPRFYEVFAEYNINHPDKPLYLFQGIWLDEENPSKDLYDTSEKFDYDIEEVIDCIHGDRSIDFRYGRAHGDFTTSVSKWVIGYILGREIHPAEVFATNDAHTDTTYFDGSSVRLYAGTPTEIWATARIDKTISYERDAYDMQRPASMSSWPTLDPLTHPTERPYTQEDLVSIDLEDIDTSNAPAGYFASFHAYPYFPDFISEDPDYQGYSDEYGPNSYLGYLQDLKDHYSSRPLIIAEFGVPSSWGNAHFGYSGMHHGGFDEKQQGEYDVRMLKNIYATGCGGGMMFSWIDEWFKNSWITEPLGPNHERRPLWHNVTGPEQNFGLVAFDSGTPDYSIWDAAESTGRISEIRAAVDNEFFHLKITLTSPLSPGEKLVVGYDTYRSDLGESVLPDGAVISNRSEFALTITSPDSAQLYVTEAYNLFGIWHGESAPEQLFHSIPTDGAPWIPVRWKNNFYEDAIQNIGILHIRNETDEPSSLDAVVISGTVIDIRLPWTLLQVNDPSALLVMDDDRSTNERETTATDGIAVTVSTGSSILKTGRFVWEPWNIAPQTTEREKDSLEIFAQGLQIIPDIPDIISSWEFEEIAKGF